MSLCIFNSGNDEYKSCKYYKKYDGTIECIPFPEYLKDKYQKYTCAKKEWDYKFTTIKEYLQV